MFAVLIWFVGRLLLRLREVAREQNLLHLLLGDTLAALRQLRFFFWIRCIVVRKNIDVLLMFGDLRNANKIDFPFFVLRLLRLKFFIFHNFMRFYLWVSAKTTGCPNFFLLVWIFELRRKWLLLIEILLRLLLIDVLIGIRHHDIRERQSGCRVLVLNSLLLRHPEIQRHFLSQHIKHLLGVILEQLEKILIIAHGLNFVSAAFHISFVMLKIIWENVAVSNIDCTQR